MDHFGNDYGIMELISYHYSRNSWKSKNHPEIGWDFLSQYLGKDSESGEYI
jgi:hypothetical protein